MNSHSAATALLLQAKHNEDEKERLFAGREAISCCVETGDYDTLIRMSNDSGLPSAIMGEAKKSVFSAVLNAKSPADALIHPDMTTAYAKELAGHLITYFVNNEERLYQIASKQECVYDIKLAAAEALIKIAKAATKYSLLLEMATDKEIAYEARKISGKLLIELAVKNGNYPILLKMGEQGHNTLPTDVWIDLEGKADLAVARSIILASQKGDKFMLKAITDDTRLSDDIRMSAFDRLEALEEKERNGAKSKDQLERELMGRLASSGTVAIKTMPPDPKNRR